MKILAVLISLFLLSSSAVVQQEDVTVAVAANAQYAMKEIEQQYERTTGKKITLIVGSSGKLCAQIKEGAPFDVFLSADMEYPQVLSDQGFTIGIPKPYGNGILVLWTMKERSSLSMQTLLQADIKTIAVANPKLAPYGEAAISALNYYNIYPQTSSKLVYGESLSQVNQYVSTQTADIGFTAKSVVLSPEMLHKGTWVEINSKAYAPIVQGAVLLKASLTRNASGANHFYTYLYSEQAKTIFKKYGYQLPE